MDTFPISHRHVLDHLTEAQAKKLVDDLKGNLGKLQVDFSDVDFVGLGEALERLPQQLKEVRNLLAEQGGLPSEDKGESSDLPIPRPEVARAVAVFDETVAYLAANHANFESFTTEVAPVVEAKQDADLNTVWKELVAAGKNKRQPKQCAAADYYARFIPPTREIERQPPNVLHRLFEALVAAIKGFFKHASRGADLLWEVMKDPDSYYLRLRGEVHELQRLNPGLKVLELLLFVPDLFRLYIRLLLDHRVSISIKGELALAVAYLVLPVDLIPEGLVGPAGYTEDVIFLAVSILNLTNANAIAPGLIRAHWSGREGTLEPLVAMSTFLATRVDFFQAIIRWMQGKAVPAI